MNCDQRRKPLSLHACFPPSLLPSLSADQKKDHVTNPGTDAYTLLLLPPQGSPVYYCCPLPPQGSSFLPHTLWISYSRTACLT